MSAPNTAITASRTISPALTEPRHQRASPRRDMLSWGNGRQTVTALGSSPADSAFVSLRQEPSSMLYKL